MSQKLVIYTDGGARGNPGPAGIGVVIQDESGNVLKEHKAYIGETTNNQAEYQAVAQAFELLGAFDVSEISFMIDSELVVKQLNREYKVKDPGLREWFMKINNAQQPYADVSYTHVRRELNTEADRLVNEAIDEQGMV